MKRGPKKAETAAVQPMDESVREERTGTPVTNNQRVCWAIKTLNDEVWALFPETPVEYSDYDGRNTALSVTYDLTALDENGRIDFAALFRLLGDEAHSTDRRIREVAVSMDDSTDRTLADAVYVAMHANPRTQDRRDSFGLANALSVLAGDDFPDADDDPDDVWEGGDASTTSSAQVDGGGA